MVVIRDQLETQIALVSIKLLLPSYWYDAEHRSSSLNVPPMSLIKDPEHFDDDFKQRAPEFKNKRRAASCPTFVRLVKYQVELSSGYELDLDPYNARLIRTPR